LVVALTVQRLVALPLRPTRPIRMRSVILELLMTLPW
jgi:hypothetical protein